MQCAFCVSLSFKVNIYLKCFNGLFYDVRYKDLRSEVYRPAKNIKQTMVAKVNQLILN